MRGAQPLKRLGLCRTSKTSESGVSSPLTLSAFPKVLKEQASEKKLT